MSDMIMGLFSKLIQRGVDVPDLYKAGTSGKRTITGGKQEPITNYQVVYHVMGTYRIGYVGS